MSRIFIMSLFLYCHKLCVGVLFSGLKGAVETLYVREVFNMFEFVLSLRYLFA